MAGCTSPRNGEEVKVFHVRDGSGLVALQRAGVAVAIISGRASAAVTHRARELGIAHVRQGISDKGAALDALCGELGVAREELACVGDDTPDIPMFERAGIAVAVADAHPGSGRPRRLGHAGARRPRRGKGNMRPAAGRARLLIKRIVTGAALLAGGLLLVTLLAGRPRRRCRNGSSDARTRLLPDRFDADRNGP